MKNVIFRVLGIGLMVASGVALAACGEGGGGCGGVPPDTSQMIQCGSGTHQEGNMCVRNTPENSNQAPAAPVDTGEPNTL